MYYVDVDLYDVNSPKLDVNKQRVMDWDRQCIKCTGIMGWDR